MTAPRQQVTAETIMDRLGAAQVVQAPNSNRAAVRAWPVLHEPALHGLAGHVVATISPHSEADPAALLATLLATAGAMIGARPHVFAGDTCQPARIWPLVIGSTAAGMKGTSWHGIRRVREAAERVAAAADPLFSGANIAKGLSSGEGLIEAVRDPVGQPDDPDFDEGVADKRLLVVEPEFAACLSRAGREGNTLGPTLRDAWDGSSQLRTMSRKNSRLVATDPHVVIVAHITPTELLLKLSAADVAGGTMNRFLPILSRRSKKLPRGGGAPESEVVQLGAQLRDAVQAAGRVGRMHRDEEAEDYWCTELYDRLTPDYLPDGPVAAVIARAVPQVIRLSVIYALLDHADTIDLAHLRAAEAVWTYVQESAWHVFGTSNPDLQRLRAFIDAAGDAGATRTSITVECFGRHRTKDQLDNLVSELVALGDYEEYVEPTAGRPSHRVRRKK